MNTKNIKFKQGALRAGLCLFMLSGTCTLSMQAQSDNAAVTTSAGASKVVMKEISGHAYDAATKQPLAGVRVKALNNGRYMAMTDEKGAYTIKVPEYVTSLYFSTDDYNGVQLPIKGATGQDASLYSAQLKGLYTDGTQLLVSRNMQVDNSSAVTIEEDIETYMGGSVHTMNRGGLPAQGAAMFINGINSLNANSQPLVIVDGVMWDMQYDRGTLHDGFVNNVFNILDPNDVASVELIRNGTALYGARGAN
ncbi:MAG: TonB-dependent receptor plug domain-containing protein, partial [Bacteroidaceae bacterium]|nr:TonB-dependent receptor plug domain-containing protein [Bacteroidaceae bacterium]